MVVLDVSTCNWFSHFSCNVLLEVDSILRFRRFASRWPFSLPLCLVVSAMKKTAIKIGGGCLFTDVISRLREITSLINEHSLCFFPWRSWFFSPFYFVHFGSILAMFWAFRLLQQSSFRERGSESSFSRRNKLS
jgi:hypothetical protein